MQMLRQTDPDERRLIAEQKTLSDICVASATPPGQSGLAVIRLSGPGCAELAEPLFRPASERFPPVRQMAGYTCAVGDLVDPTDGALLDQVVLTRFTAPHSFTGEEVIEIACHGGSAVKQSILDLLVQHGARPATAGEFTKRAFLNGKMDLTQAEAVMDLITADAAMSAKNAAAQLHGQLSEQVRRDTQTLYDLLAGVELIMEFPEHDEGGPAGSSTAEALAVVAARLEQRAGSYEQGRRLREGLTVVLAGRPNVGKSSLLNALAGYERAIVTPLPGTTRDTVEERIEVNGIPVRLIDTAGVRETTDTVEQLGVARARAALQQADIVFWLFSPPAEALELEVSEVMQAGCRNLIPLVSKDDLAASAKLLARLKCLLPQQAVMTCSALTGEGLAQIRQAIVAVYEQHGSMQQEGVLVSNSRQRVCLEQAALAVRQAEADWRRGLTLDVVALLLRRALDALAELTGDHVTDELIDTIFSRFCIGK